MKTIIIAAVLGVVLGGCYASHEQSPTPVAPCGVGGASEAEAVDVGELTPGATAEYDADGEGWAAVSLDDASDTHDLTIEGDVVDVTATCDGGGVFECSSSSPHWRVLPGLDYPDLPRNTMPACRYVAGAHGGPTTFRVMCFDRDGNGTPARVLLRSASGACSTVRVSEVAS